MSSLDDGSHGAKTLAGHKGKSSNRRQTITMILCLGEDKYRHKHSTTCNRSLMRDHLKITHPQAAGLTVPLQMSPSPSPSQEEVHAALWATLMDAIAELRNDMEKLNAERQQGTLDSLRAGGSVPTGSGDPNAGLTATLLCLEGLRAEVAGLNAGFLGFSSDVSSSHFNTLIMTESVSSPVVIQNIAMTLLTVPSEPSHTSE
ncbi:hypothetical protein E2C01_047183 [Portunus trituberculatus]|uniref:Uncharacterized protein n=1 Tax=Portunus trituberculatus TaxID=210409 RepID=A0A5B7G9S2_PORTR|nr:hypothetical protein [Portunus trituberculatus]